MAIRYNKYNNTYHSFCIKGPITNRLAPPEKHMTNRAIRQTYDERTKRLLVAWDSWTLGIILFYLLTGKTMPSFDDVTQANLKGTREKIRKCVSIDILYKYIFFEQNIGLHSVCLNFEKTCSFIFIISVFYLCF